MDETGQERNIANFLSNLDNQLALLNEKIDRVKGVIQSSLKNTPKKVEFNHQSSLSSEKQFSEGMLDCRFD